MEYLALTLYLLGCYMQLHLGKNVMDLQGDNAYETTPMVIGCMLWPLAAAWFLLRRIVGA